MTQRLGPWEFKFIPSDEYFNCLLDLYIMLYLRLSYLMRLRPGLIFT